MNRPALFLCESGEGDEALLSDAERARLGDFTGPRRKSQSLRARTLLHRALAEIFAGAAKSLEVRTEADGRPIIVGGPEVSIAHSGKLVAVLLSPDGACGVDVEDGSVERDFAALARAEFGPQTKLGGSARVFYEAWCVKEARFKAGGPGAASVFRFGSFHGAVVLAGPGVPECFLYEERFRPTHIEFEPVERIRES